MQYAYTLTTILPASAQEIYDAWLDSLAHTEMTGGEAAMSDEIGAQVVAWDGYITGRNLELVPGERIVQSWRTGEFTDQHEDSIITVTLEEIADGTLLTLVHSKVPADHTFYEQGGWQEHYFEPMQEYFKKRKRRGGKSKAAPTAKTKTKAKSKTKPTATRAKSKTAKSRPKISNKKKSKRAVAKAKPKGAKKAKRKTAAGKRRK